MKFKIFRFYSLIDVCIAFLQILSILEWTAHSTEPSQEPLGALLNKGSKGVKTLYSNLSLPPKTDSLETEDWNFLPIYLPSRNLLCTLT